MIVLRIAHRVAPALAVPLLLACPAAPIQPPHDTANLMRPSSGVDG